MTGTHIEITTFCMPGPAIIFGITPFIDPDRMKLRFKLRLPHSCATGQECKQKYDNNNFHLKYSTLG